MYKVALFIILFIPLFGIEIDIKGIEKSLQKNDVKSRLLLGKYYFDKRDINKSRKYIVDALNLDIKNREGHKLFKKLIAFDDFQKVLKDDNQSIATIDKFYQKIYFNKEYIKIKSLSKYLEFVKSDYPKLVTARIYMWDGEYKKSNKILSLVKDKTKLDYVEIRANNCYYLANYRCARYNFSLLYDSTYKLLYAYKLLNVYFLMGDMDRANRFLKFLLKTYPNDKNLLDMKDKIDEMAEKRVKTLQNSYKESGNFEDLQKLVSVLLTLKRNKEAYSFLEEYIKKHPRDIDAQYQYAVYLSWDGDNKKAFKILEKISNQNDYRVKLLLGKILSWNGEYKKAINYLNNVILNAKDENLVIDAKEAKGLIYFWAQDYEKSRPILKEVLKKKASIEAKEALMLMNGNIEPLIKKYKLLVKLNPRNLDYLLRLAQFYEIVKNVDGAIEYYEKYYALKQNIEVAHSLAKLYLIKKNVYKGFGYYEYWAYQKDRFDSLLELAKAYYYNGYSKSALDVLNDLISKYPNRKEALKLKAKILRLSPKYTQNASKKNLSDILREKSDSLLKLADRLYFNGFYTEASKYYKKYLLENANNYDVRERYAFSLEFVGKYKEASAEFFLLSWMKKDCNLLYHYGFSLEKSDKKKKALMAYSEAMKYSLKPLPKVLDNFIESWKKSWESQNIDEYKKFYVKKYRKNRRWLLRKENIFKSVNFISLYLAGKSLISENRSGKFMKYRVKFFQQYTTNRKVDKGYKILTLRCRSGECLIEDEKWYKGKYIAPDYQCYQMVENRIEQKPTSKITMDNLLKDTNNSLNEIVLASGLKKNLQQENVVLEHIDVNLTNKLSIHKVIKIDKENKEIQNILHKIGVLADYSKDKENVQFLDYGVYYKQSFSENWGIYLNSRKWILWQDEKERIGKSATIHGIYKNMFMFGGEIGKYEEHTLYFYPYLEYDGFFTYMFDKRVVGKDKQSFNAVDKNLSSLNFSISKYKSANVGTKKELADYWVSLEYSNISDGNSVVTPQFLYKFNKEHQISPYLYSYYYLSGWYQFNSKESDDYYSPSKYDSTFFEWHPIFYSLEGIFKIGYSFIGKTTLYSYGFDFNYNKNLSIKCMKNHSYKDGVSGYWYEECHFDAGFEF